MKVLKISYVTVLRFEYAHDRTIILHCWRIPKGFPPNWSIEVYDGLKLRHSGSNMTKKLIRKSLGAWIPSR